MQIIRFNVDTKHRKQWFTGLSFSHPAKMTLPLQLWLIENFTKEGETILDPMAGSGTVLVACSLGRHVIAVDLEQKFVDMMAGYDCDGQVKGYEDVEISSAQESGWILDIIDDPWMASPFATREDALAFKNANWADAEKWEIYYQEAEPAVFEKQPVPSRCGKRGEHNPHRVVGNWEKIQERGCQMGYSMGTATILQGDARNLTGMLVDKILFSPPYQETRPLSSHEPQRAYTSDLKREIKESHLVTEGNIGNLPYGNVDKIITSPPYEGSIIDGNENFEGLRHLGTINKENIGKKRKQLRAYQFGKETTAYGEKQIDAVISSPPYEASGIASGTKGRFANYTEKGDLLKQIGYDEGYNRSNQENIGNLKNDSYLSAMLQVYQQCYAVLRPGGLMVLVTKNFIRNKQQVRLDLDTVRLCETAGFTFQERWYRELSSQSFWRTIYHAKYSDVEPIKFEDILIFIKG